MAPGGCPGLVVTASSGRWPGFDLTKIAVRKWVKQAESDAGTRDVGCPRMSGRRLPGCGRENRPLQHVDLLKRATALSAMETRNIRSSPWRHHPYRRVGRLATVVDLASRSGMGRAVVDDFATDLVGPPCPRRLGAADRLMGSLSIPIAASIHQRSAWPPRRPERAAVAGRPVWPMPGEAAASRDPEQRLRGSASSLLVTRPEPMRTCPLGHEQGTRSRCVGGPEAGSRG